MAQNVSADDVRKISKLARLALSESEAAAARDYLTSIVGYAESLRSVETKNVGQYDAPDQDFRSLRRDEPRSFATRDALARPGAMDARGLLTAPPVFKKTASATPAVSKDEE